MTAGQYQVNLTVDGLPYTPASFILETDIKLTQSKRSAALIKKDKKHKKTSDTSGGAAIHSAIRRFLNTGDCVLTPQYYLYFDCIYKWLPQLDRETWQEE